MSMLGSPETDSTPCAVRRDGGPSVAGAGASRSSGAEIGSARGAGRADSTSDADSRSTASSHAPTVIPCGMTGVTFGENVTVVHPTKLDGCVLGESVFVGPFTEVQPGVCVGARTRLQSHAFVASNVCIGEDCFVGHGVKFASSAFTVLAPHISEDDLPETGAAVVGNNVLIGTNATILPVTICDNVVIGAGAVVMSDITASGKYVGVPARRMGERKNGSNAGS
ncbi:acetyltransferase [Thecamonas trahens ATCC 50062]|uniref:Acetyltransferase n=1 Tax=Thecamonas trahens ATCC 50062 TaxID=461836 RepID=A0A0L0DNX8_THETB|nr:acetyltransferase [Thecamonas trahens ATCC 50062]KNC53721.1 acetyltransferase [Thecamonas trahens ATCC 50062]|eukprot:XP_013762035.1 acetyltransferase [Thecamonas trahens ATCC 50062]